jgi:DNA polymerase-4
VFAIFEDITPLVEGISIDEAFLDVGGLRRLSGSPVEIAERLRRRVREEVGLAITVGVASTKHLAKVASQVGKPDGLLEVPAGAELEFLHPLPIERLWGVGAKTAEKLHGRGIHLVGDLAALPKPALSSMLGAASGHHLYALAHNLDPRRVTTGVRRRSIGSQSALGHRRRSQADLDAVLVGLVDRVTRRLRSADRVGRTVVLRLRFDDMTRATRSHTLDEPTAETPVILEALRGLLREAMERIREDGITLLGISISNLDDADAVQLTLPFRGHENRTLDAALDEVREKFGSDSLRRAVLVGRRQGWEAPRLPGSD